MRRKACCVRWNFSPIPEKSLQDLTQFYMRTKQTDKAIQKINSCA